MNEKTIAPAPTERMAIIRDVCFGRSDRGDPVMRFSCYTELGVSCQELEWQAAGEMVVESGLGDASKLDGRACVVLDNHGHGMNHTVKFVRLLDI